MQLIGAAATDINQLQSNAGAYRNRDFAVNAGQVFSGGTNLNGAASNYAHHQIKNPSGSGIVTLVDRVILAPSAASRIGIRTYDTDLASKAGDYKANKLGGADGQTEARYENNTSALGTSIGNIEALALTPLVIDFEYPIMIEAGKGLNFVNLTTNVGLLFWAFVREV